MRFQELLQNGRLAWRLLHDPRVPQWVKVLVPLIVAIYVISPIDFIPDFIPVLGQLDDVGVVLLGLTLISRLSPQSVVEEHKRALGYPSSGSSAGAGSAAASASYWNMPPDSGEPTSSTAPSGSGADGAIEGEYKVITPE